MVAAAITHSEIPKNQVMGTADGKNPQVPPRFRTNEHTVSWCGLTGNRQIRIINSNVRLECNDSAYPKHDGPWDDLPSFPVAVCTGSPQASRPRIVQIGHEDNLSAPTSGCMAPISFRPGKSRNLCKCRWSPTDNTAQNQQGNPFHDSPLLNTSPIARSNGPKTAATTRDTTIEYAITCQGNPYAPHPNILHKTVQ